MRNTKLLLQRMSFNFFWQKLNSFSLLRNIVHWHSLFSFFVCILILVASTYVVLLFLIENYFLHFKNVLNPSVTPCKNTYQFLFLILSAWGDRMYSSTICFQRLRHSQPRKKLWTFLIFPMSGSSSSSSLGSHSRVDFDTCGRNLQSFFKAHNYKNNNNNKFNKIIFIYYYIGEVLQKKVYLLHISLFPEVQSCEMKCPKDNNRI